MPTMEVDGEVIEVQDQVPLEEVISTEEEDFVVSDEPVVDDESQKIIEDLKAKQAELAKQVDPVAALKEAVAGLGGALKPAEQVDVRVKPNVGVNDWGKYREEFNTKVFEDPFQQIVDLVGKAREMDSATVANQNLAYSKRIAQVDPGTKPFMDRWHDEIEREVAKRPVNERATNPNIYEDAIRIVKANHIDELVAEAVSKTKEQNSTTTPAARAPYTEAGRGASPIASAAPRAKTVVSAAKMNEIRNFAEERMIPVEVAIRMYKNEGRL